MHVIRGMIVIFINITEIVKPDYNNQYSIHEPIRMSSNFLKINRKLKSDILIVNKHIHFI